MRKMIIASHGNFAEGALDAALLIGGEADCEVQVFCMRPGESPEDFASGLEAEITASPEKEFIILADLFGASICNTLYSLSRYSNVKLFSDFNLRLLLEIMVSYKKPLNRSDMDDIVSINRKCLQALYFEKTTKGEDF